MLRHPTFACALALGMLFSGAPVAAPPTLRAEAPYVRLAPPHAQATGAFLRLHNDANTARQLVKADSPVARTVELHDHINDNGVMKMRPVPHIVVPARGQVDLKPGSYHVMLIDMKAPLREGENVPLTLTFDDGSTLHVTAPVRKPHDGAPAMRGHGQNH